jgi:dihydroflavonol-4-reductase
MKLKIALTGGSGHLGTVLIIKLLRQGQRIRALKHRFQPPLNHANLEWISGDITDPSSVSNLISGCDVVIHSAAKISIKQDPEVFDVNVKGTRNVVEACVKHKVRRMIHISSTHATKAMPHHTRFDESRPLNLKSKFYYDRSKAMGEQIVSEAIVGNGLDAIILRPSGMVGPPDYQPSVFGQALIDMVKGKFPVLVGGGYNYVDVRDVADSVVNSIEMGRKGETYCLTGSYLAIRDFAIEIEHIKKVKCPRFSLNPRVLLIFLPIIKLHSLITKSELPFTRHSMVTLKEGHPYMTNDKAVKDLKHSARSWKDSVADLFEWFEEEEYI